MAANPNLWEEETECHKPPWENYCSECVNNLTHNMQHVTVGDDDKIKCYVNAYDYSTYLQIVCQLS